jgi:hypothetical protein
MEILALLLLDFLNPPTIVKRYPYFHFVCCSLFRSDARQAASTATGESFVVVRTRFGCPSQGPFSQLFLQKNVCLYSLHDYQETGVFLLIARM